MPLDFNSNSVQLVVVTPFHRQQNLVWNDNLLKITYCQLVKMQVKQLQIFGLPSLVMSSKPEVPLVQTCKN